MATVILENQAKRADEKDIERMLREIEAMSEAETRRLLDEEGQLGK